MSRTSVSLLALLALALPPHPASARASGIDAEVAAIDAMPLTERERMLEGIATEGAHVDAYFDDFRCRKITVEMLFESGRRYRTIYFANGKPIRIHAVDVTYPNHYMTYAEPHSSFSIEKTDTVAADGTYDFAGNRLVAFRSPLKDADDKDASEKLAEAGVYLRFAEMPERDGAWACEGEGPGGCARFVTE